MRGGTSKGLFLDPVLLPPAGPARDTLLAGLIGSPDPYARQLDGLGGATSSTSKICLISASRRADADVDFTFGHVDIATGAIDYSGNCGNLSSAVGVYAVEEALVAPVAPITTVRVWQANLGRFMEVHVPVTERGTVRTSGTRAIAGVPGTGAEIAVDFLRPGHDAAGHVLPRNEPVTQLTDGEILIDASLVHAGNATVFIRAADVGLRGDELPAEIEADDSLKQRLERLRGAGAVAMGLADDADWVTGHKPATPKIALVAPPRNYEASDGSKISATQVDIVSRIMSMGLAHHTYTGTGAIALAVASRVPGTLVHDCLAHKPAESGDVLQIGHPAGVLPASAEVVTGEDAQPVVLRARLFRTARTLMVGEIPTRPD